MRHIRVVEIAPHCSSIQSIRLSEKVGFVRQASIPNKIRYTDGTFVNEIVLHWTNPHFCE
jgi:RimJ/RimL family protein N-acetyltransferase